MEQGTDVGTLGGDFDMLTVQILFCIVQNHTSYIDSKAHGFKISSHLQETQSAVRGSNSCTHATGM